MRFLVIQTKRLGDVIFSSALCQSLKRSWPDSEVHYLVYSEYASLVEQHPLIDQVIVMDSARRKDVTYLWYFLNHIRQTGYDTVINVQGQLIGLLVSLFSRACKRVAFRSFPWHLGSNLHVSFSSGSDIRGNGLVVDDRFQILSPLKLLREDRQYRIYLAPSEVQVGRDQLDAYRQSDTCGVIALGVNAAMPYKRWPLSYYAQLAIWLIETFHVDIWVYVGPGEIDYNCTLKKMLPTHLQRFVIDTLSTPTVRILAQLLNAVDLYVGNDTGPRVLCQALNRPTFGIASPRADIDVWNPHNHPCFRGISVNDVLKLPKAQWKLICEQISDREEDNRPWLEKITPKMLQEPLMDMVVDLGLFAGFAAESTPVQA